MRIFSLFIALALSFSSCSVESDIKIQNQKEETIAFRTDDDAKGSKCDCYYSIIDIQYPPEFADFFFQFGESTIPLTDACGDGCPIFGGVGNISGCAPFAQPNCFIQYPVPPLGTFDFNCLVNPGYIFSVGGWAYEFAPECMPVTNTSEVTVTYQICCSKAEYVGCNVTNCSEVKAITLMSGSNNDDQWKIESFECGCKAVLN